MIDRIQMIREAHAKVLAEKGQEISELLPVTKEDVEDEAEHLDALNHQKEINFDDDENEVDMDTLSPSMKKLYS